MQKWEYLNVHVERIMEVSIVYANNKQVIKSKEDSFYTDLALYLNSLGEQGWEMVNAQNREHGFREYFFKRPTE